MRRIDFFVLFSALWNGIVAPSGARAEDRSAPTPKAVIYPGETITGDMLGDRILAPEEDTTQKQHISREELIGKVARRTLLPGDTISPASIDNPRLVKIGANVRIIFIEGGMQITAMGVAQQAGAVGDMIRVRNQDSGLFVTGRIEADGSVQVGDGG